MRNHLLPKILAGKRLTYLPKIIGDPIKNNLLSMTIVNHGSKLSNGQFPNKPETIL